MDAQTILNTYVDEAIVFSNERIRLQKEHMSFFENMSDISDVKKSLSTMNDEQLGNYFKTSQISTDNQTIFNKISLFIKICDQLGIELDKSNLNNVKGLVEYVANNSFNNTDYIVVEDNLVPRDSKANIDKFNEFKKSLPKFLGIM